MKNHKITQFTEPDILQSIGAIRLNLLFQKFAGPLNAAELHLPSPDAERPETFAELAAALKTQPLPPELQETLGAIETAASPENADWLEDTRLRRIPCISIPPLRLDLALEIFFAAPDELDGFRPSSSDSVQSPSSDNSPLAHNEAQQSPDLLYRDSPTTSPPSSDQPSSPSPLPQNHNGLHLQPIDPWQEPVNGSELLDKLVAEFKRFIVMPEWGPETTALFILHTFAYQLRDVSVYLGIESPEKQCGKTTLLTVINELAHRAITAANISPPAFFRVIEDLSPTLLIDEADTFLRGNDQLRGILKAGYKRKTAYVLRAGPLASFSAENPLEAGPGQVTRFSCWCPKVMAGIGRLPDTLADRCIVIRMQRKTAHERCERLRDLDVEILKRQCLRFVEDHREAIASAKPELPPALSDRAADIWEPLLVLADLAGGDWPERARKAAISLTSASSEQSPIASLLLDIFIRFVMEDTDRVPSRRLVERLNTGTDRPWMEKNRVMTERILSQHLRPYGIKPKLMRIGDLVARGYVKDDFTETFGRYIPRSEIEELCRQHARPEEPASAPTARKESLSP